MQLDMYDRNILVEVQRNADATYAEIGEKVNLSASAVLRRIAKMKEEKVITGTHMVVDARLVGRPVTIVVEITLENERLGLLDEAKASLAAAPEVQHCYCVTGDVDIFAVVTMPGMEDYDAFARRILFSNPNIKRFRTSVVMQRLKSTMFVPTQA